jgi:aminoglycoside 3-N-acetyltransferase
MLKNKIIDDLSVRWQKSGLKNGDTFLLHSNIKRLLLEFKRKKIDINTDLIIDSFLNVIGSTGTIIVPLFNFDFIKTNYFSNNNTVSQMGILTECFRVKYSNYRTSHPVYSFGVYGEKQQLFSEIDNYSAYSEESPFGILKNLNAKIAILDLEDQNSMTFYHHIEEVNNVSWRYFKKFKGICENKNGKRINKEYSIYVRKIELNIQTNVNPAGDLLWKNNIYHGCKPFIGTGLRVIEMKPMFQFITNIIKKNEAKGILYKIES